MLPLHHTPKLSQLTTHIFYHIYVEFVNMFFEKSINNKKEGKINSIFLFYGHYSNHKEQI